MTTSNNNLASLESIAGSMTKLIKEQSLAFQICDVQYSTSPSPQTFGVKKADGTTGLEITKKELIVDDSASNVGFTEEVIDDIFAIFGEDATLYLENIAANEVIDDLDSTILTYLNSIATDTTDLVLDFSTETNKQILLNDLIFKINKERATIALGTKRGLPRNLVVSPSVGALFSSAKMISNINEGHITADRDNIKFLGMLGDLNVYIDFEATSDYVLIVHKTYMPGDASVIITPISTLPRISYRTDAESGQKKIYFKYRFAYSRNPLDASTTADSIFCSRFDLTLTGYDAI